MIDSGLYTLLLSRVRGRNTVLDELLRRKPDLGDYAQTEGKATLLQRSPVDVMRLHLCGPGGAGEPFTVPHILLSNTSRWVLLDSHLFRQDNP
jgi:hypothetical protein